jgi:hypothetical protein
LDTLTTYGTYGDHRTLTPYNKYPTYATNKQMIRYQTKKDLRRIEGFLGRPTKEDTNVLLDPPTTIDTAPTAVPSSTTEIPMVVTTITLLLPGRPPLPPSQIIPEQPLLLLFRLEYWA